MNRGSCFIYSKRAKSEQNIDIYHTFAIFGYVQQKKNCPDSEISAFLHIYSRFCVPGQEKVDGAIQISRGGGGRIFLLRR